MVRWPPCPARPQSVSAKSLASAWWAVAIAAAFALLAPVWWRESASALGESPSMSQSETRDGEDLVDAFQDRAGHPGQSGVWRVHNEIAAPHAINKQGWNSSMDDGFRGIATLLRRPSTTSGIATSSQRWSPNRNIWAASCARPSYLNKRLTRPGIDSICARWVSSRARRVACPAYPGGPTPG
jgi:hypothetical protein